jgi:Tfp pilus assembly protein PilO
MIGSSVAKAHDIEAQVKGLQDRKEQALVLQASLGDSAALLNKLQTRIVESNGAVTFITAIETAARAAGARVIIDSVDKKAIDPKSPEAVGPDFEDLVLRISVQGSWQQVYSFVAMVESLPYKVTIQTTNVKREIFTTGEASSTESVRIWKGQMGISVLKRK